MKRKDDQRPGRSAKGKWEFFLAIVRALRTEPAYLLVFAVAALFFLASFSGEVDGIVRSDPELLSLSFAGLLASLVAVVAVIWRVESKLPTPGVGSDLPHAENVRDSGQASKLGEANHKPEIGKLLDEMRVNLDKALRVEHHVFRRIIFHDFKEFLAKTGNWASHSFVATHERYNWTLIEMYRSARQTVFSTSLPDYLPTWRSHFGTKLLQAHAASSARVTRVFIFSKRSEITPLAFSAMEDLSKSAAGQKMDLYVWIADEDKAFEYPVGLAKDFTLIDDGAAIGITLTLAGHDLSAEWHFGDAGRTETCRMVRDALIEGGERFAEFRATWQHSSAF